eukprot:TRINITY_DN3913_c0_g1_i1.p1 TRINITY_DN3913_c0_g1~~TRINITY_DN3913_c0_g1_i1.p1  ORF type:complete len:406 (+),score=69.83 TRINITY_DN3913_c0_g1_i1:950-2167(+)
MHFCCFDSLFKIRRSKGKEERQRQKQQLEDNIGDVILKSGDVTIYSYHELRIATNDFDPQNRIGVGGFGIVYKGILKDGTEVAVKKLSAQSKQGIREFLTEIATISDAKHKNLVRLYGCCVEEDNRILVYEYLEKNSIAQTLLGPGNCKSELDWRRRAEICIGTACGLSYLHEELVHPVVHRDIKASNVLLDRDYNPKISDFGLAKLFPDNITHISTRVAGTIGYLAPEYAMHGQLTKKADIYSFGILLLEIISGRGNSDPSFQSQEQDLLEWTWKLKEGDRLLDLVDSSMSDYPKEEIIRFIKVALLCTQAAANFRPSMSQVVTMLSKNININENLLVRQGVPSNYKRLKAGFIRNTSTDQTSLHVFNTTRSSGMSKVESSSSSSMTTLTSSTSPMTLTDMEAR